VALLGTTAGFIAVVVVGLLERPFNFVADAIASRGVAAVFGFSTSIFAVAALPLARASPGAWQPRLDYVPTWFSIIVGLATSHMVAPVPMEPYTLALLLACLFASGVMFFRLPLSGSVESTLSRSADPAPQSLQFDSIRSLEAWLATDDEPIRQPSDDRFGTSPIARRIAARLLAHDNDSDLPTFILRGPRGSGKTSIYHMVRYFLEHREELLSPPVHIGPIPFDSGARTLSLSRTIASRLVYCVHVSAWAYDDMQSLIRGILAEIVKELGTHADASAIGGLPDEYVAIISIVAKATSLQLPSFSRPESPSRTFSRLEHILTAIDANVLVWLDDLERFQEGKSGRDGAIDAMLCQIRKCNRLTFIAALDSKA